MTDTTDTDSTGNEVVGPEAPQSRLEELAEAAESVIENDDELQQEAREAGEQKRHELVVTTDPGVDTKGRVKEINHAMRRAAEKKLHEGIKAADAIPDEMVGKPADAVNEVVVEQADRIMDEWAISEAELSTRLENRDEPARDDTDERENAQKGANR